MSREEIDALDTCDAHMLKAAGVYAILDEENEVMYVGETQSFIKRWGEHCDPKRHNLPSIDIFTFAVLAYEDTKDKRIALEQEFTDKLQPRHYRRSAQLLLKQWDDKVNKYKLRELNKQGRKPRAYEDYLNEHEDLLKDSLKSFGLTYSEDD